MNTGISKQSPENYERYLVQKRYSQSTITVHKLRIKRFEEWLKNNSFQASSLDYKDLVQYAKYLQSEKHYQRTSTNNELRAVKLYYDYLIEKGICSDNPAQNMAIRGQYTKVLTNLLSEQELEDLYYSYEISHHDTFFKATKLRDKVVAGLLLFQGITGIEIFHLQEQHLELSKG